MMMMMMIFTNYNDPFLSKKQSALSIIAVFNKNTITKKQIIPVLDGAENR